MTEQELTDELTHVITMWFDAPDPRNKKQAEFIAKSLLRSHPEWKTNG